MAEPSPTVLIVETTAGGPPVEFRGETASVVYFISMAHSERYGADHPLAKAASILRRRLRVDISPLLKFADAKADDPAEEALQDHLWQDPAALAASARATADALESAPEVAELVEGFPGLSGRLRELAEMAVWASELGARIRLTYAI
jgi:hypothetical protein